MENLEKQLEEMKGHVAEMEDKMMLTNKKLQEDHCLHNELATQIADLQNQLKETKAEKKNRKQEVAKSEMHAALPVGGQGGAGESSPRCS